VFIENLFGLKKKIAKFLLFYYYYSTKKIYRYADSLTSITVKFLEHIENFSRRESNKRNKVFPLVSNLNLDDKNQSKSESWWDDLGVYNDQTFRVAYVGNLSSNINLYDIKKAAQSFEQKNIKVQFVISGDGEYLQKFKNMMRGLNNVVFSGSISKSKLFALANRSNIWLIPYFNKENFILSLPNKTYDALFFGLPIFSSLKGEVRDLILKNEIGMFYDKINSLEKCIIKLKDNKDLQTLMSSNAKKLYDECFEFNKVYDELIYHLENIVVNKN
jgi:glycosyltransferase involved in cell wall biosynthesis